MLKLFVAAILLVSVSYAEDHAVNAAPRSYGVPSEAVKNELRNSCEAYRVLEGRNGIASIAAPPVHVATRPSVAPTPIAVVPQAPPPRPQRPRPSTAPTPQPSAVSSAPSNAGEWDALLKNHNAERALVSAPPLTWSDRLAKQAQAWADRCDFNHTPGLKDGQNLYASSNVNESLAQSGLAASQGWGNEKTDFNAAANSCATGKVCGHYTQMVWKSTTEVGCAQKQCPSGLNGTGFRGGVIVVCDYAPPGNFVGQRPF